jgi:glycosyltransferase involved in cell wall biosynthesis
MPASVAASSGQGTVVPQPSALPTLSVVICTRDRGARFAGAVESVLAGTRRPAEIVVVDQSADGRSLDASRRFASVPGFRVLRVDSTGLARARNAGLALARGDAVAYTDDDCEVSPDWLDAIADGFARDPRIGAVFGNVRAGPHDAALGFIPAYVRDVPLLATSLGDKHRAEGIGANMAVRRTVASALGGFDERLGAGGAFRAGEDIDFAMRALERGHAIYETTQGHVVHLGFHPWDDLGRVAHDYLYGLGATYAKHLKCGEAAALVPLARLAGRWAAGRPAVDLGRTPARWLRLRAFAAGFLAAVREPVDARATRFAAGRVAA